MKFSLNLLFVILFFFSSCNPTKEISKELSNISTTLPNFPDDYIGQWEGSLKIYSAKGLQQEIPMGLNILPIEDSERHTFMIRYGEDKEENKRNYELMTIDKVKGQYKVDEKNSIMMEAYYIGGKLFQTFEVAGNLLTSTLERKGDELIWEITSGKLEPISVSGGEKVDGEDIPEVKAYPMRVYQKGVLRKAE